MTSYESEEHYLKVQISSFRKAKKILRKYQEKIDKELLPDFSGDRDKVLKGIEMGLKYLDAERKELQTTLNTMNK